MCGCRHGLPIAAVSALVCARACWAAGGPLANPMGTFVEVALYLPALLLGIGLHEFAHAWVADRLGDSTPEDEGRLSLNPLDHLDPMGSALILIAFAWRLPLIGWGLPVRVSANMFRNPIRDMMKVGLAGPLMNLAIAGTGAAACFAFDSIGYGTQFGLPGEAAARVATMLYAIVMTNISLAAFNLLPLPPLDGAWIAREFINADQTLLLAQIEPFGFIILLMLMQTPILSIPFYYVHKLGAAMIGSPWVLGGALLLTGLGWYFLVRSLPDYRFRDKDDS